MSRILSKTETEQYVIFAIKEATGKITPEEQARLEQLDRRKYYMDNRRGPKGTRWLEFKQRETKIRKRKDKRLSRLLGAYTVRWLEERKRRRDAYEAYNGMAGQVYEFESKQKP